MQTFKLTKAIGGNTDLLSSQSFVFQGSVNETDHVIFIVLLSGSGEDVFTKLRNIGFSLEQHFFSLEQPSLTERLQQTMDFLTAQIANLPLYSALISVLKDEALFILSTGTAEALLIRQEKTTPLTQPEETQLISGYLQPGDKALFLTPRFIPDPLPEGEQAVGWEDYFVQRLLLSDQEVVEEEITSYLQQKPSPEPIAVVVLSTQPLQQEQQTVSASVDQNEDRPIPQLPRHQRPEFDERTRPLPVNKRNFGLPPIPSTSLLSRIPLIKIKRMLIKIIFPLTFKKLGVLATLLLVIIGFSVFSLIQYQQAKAKSSELNTALSQTRNNIALAQSNKDTNPEAAKQYLAFAKSSFDKASLIEPANNTLPQLKTELASSQQQILKSAEITNWQTYLSLDLIKPGFTARKMSFSLEKFLLLDETQKSLVQIDLATKSNELLAGQNQLGNAQIASLNGDFAFVYSEDKGILRVETSTKRIATVATPDNEWGRIVDIVGFSSNVYALDAGGNQIWKYIPAQTSYSDKQIYLKDNQSLDFTSAKQLFIDYSVWVLKDNAELTRFTGGSRDFYSIGGLDTPLTNIETIFAPEEEDKLFILDPGNKRIVLTKKNGEYISQYTSTLFATATDLIYDESTKTLYLLEGGKIHQTLLP